MATYLISAGTDPACVQRALTLIELLAQIIQERGIEELGPVWRAAE